ncbi:LysE family transporter [Bdellovibrio sp. HCB-162]|uniref:LysE family transporter n=1 Tax=Bdellovibrio sp. HCB-162 TaxID=3394234 RepID=UPI0039BC4B26
MILWLMLVGFLSAFALGPASFNIIRSLINKRTWPWDSIAGFLLGDIFYITLALLLLQSPLLQLTWLKTLLTGLTVASLVLYSGKILFPSLKDKDQEVKPSQQQQQGFKSSLLLTLSNFHLVFIYAGLFVNISHSRHFSLFAGVMAYFMAFLVTFFALLWALRSLQSSLKNVLRRIEMVAAFGFLTFSVYLSLEIL